MQVRAVSAALGIGAVLTAFVLGACGASEYRYLSNSSEKTYVRVPSDWSIFDEEAFFANVEDLSPQQLQAQKARQWVVAFDAAPEPSIDHVSVPGRHPAGLVRVRLLGAADQDLVSLKTLRSTLLGVDPIEAEQGGDPNVEVLAYDDVTRAGGIRGVHMIVNLRGATGQEFITTNYVALTDSATSRLYSIFIGCRASCYEEHKTQIEAIVDSWTVRER